MTSLGFVCCIAQLRSRQNDRRQFGSRRHDVAPTSPDAVTLQRRDERRDEVLEPI
jgi:hypothetical protein